MTRLFLTAALLASAAALACGSSSPHEQAASVAKGDEAAAASVQMLATEWSKGHVPDKYARQTLDALNGDLTQQGQTLASIKRDDSLIAEAVAAHDSISAQVKQLQHSFDASDKGAALRTAGALGVLSRRLDSLGKRLQPPQ